MLYMVTFAINIPPMLAYIPYMDPMGKRISCSMLQQPMCLQCLPMWVPVQAIRTDPAAIPTPRSRHIFAQHVSFSLRPKLQVF